MWRPLCVIILTVTSCEFTGCWSSAGTDYFGGAILVSDANLVSTSCTFNSCTASDGAGGAIGYFGSSSTSMTIQKNAFNGCTSLSTSGYGFGGGLAVGAGSSGTLSISDSTFAACSARCGGGFYVDSQTSSKFTNCQFSSCTASSMGGAGDANAPKTVTIDGCTFTSCTGWEYAGCILIISNPQATFIAKNSVSTSCRSESVGGVFFCYNISTATLTNYTVSGCTAYESSGFLGSNYVTTITLQKCKLTMATSESDMGGVMYVATGTTLTCTECTFEKGRAVAVAGIYGSKFKYITIQDCTISKCRDTGDGVGFFYTADATKVVVQNCVMSECSTPSAMSCLDIIRTATVEIKKCVFVGCYAYNSATLYLSSCPTAVIQECVFDNCSATVGDAGGIVMTGCTSSTSFTDCNFTSCKAGDWASCIRITNCNGLVSFTRCGFLDSQAYACGAFAFGESSKLQMSNCKIRNCRANSNAAGAGYIYNTTSFTLTNCVLEDCYAYDAAGALFFANCAGTVTSCTFSGISALSSGGALLVNGLCAVQFTGCTFTDCLSDSDGGVAFFYGKVSMTDAIVTNCHSVGAYGGFICFAGEIADIYNCRITSCSAYYSGGAISQASTGQMNIEKCIISSCVAKDSYTLFGGGGLFSWSGTTTITDTVIENCESKREGGGICLSRQSGGGDAFLVNVTINNCKCAGRGAAIFCDRNVSRLSLVSVSSVKCISTTSSMNYKVVYILKIASLEWSNLCIPEQGSDAVYCADTTVVVPSRHELIEQCPATVEFKMYSWTQGYVRTLLLMFNYHICQPYL